MAEEGKGGYSGERGAGERGWWVPGGPGGEEESWERLVGAPGPGDVGEGSSLGLGSWRRRWARSVGPGRGERGPRRERRGGLERGNKDGEGAQGEGTGTRGEETGTEGSGVGPGEREWEPRERGRGRRGGDPGEKKQGLEGREGTPGRGDRDRNGRVHRGERMGAQGEGISAGGRGPWREEDETWHPGWVRP